MWKTWRHRPWAGPLRMRPRITPQNWPARELSAGQSESHGPGLVPRPYTISAIPAAPGKQEAAPGAHQACRICTTQQMGSSGTCLSPSQVGSGFNSPPRTSHWGTKSHVELELAASGPLGSAAQQGSPGGGQSSTSHTHPPEKALLPCSKRLCRLGVEGEFVFTPSRLFLDDPELKSDPSSKLAKPPQDQYAPKNKFRRR